VTLAGEGEGGTRGDLAGGSPPEGQARLDRELGCASKAREVIGPAEERGEGALGHCEEDSGVWALRGAA
jgi:hypothetical protein